jgi:hypothetical protein
MPPRNLNTPQCSEPRDLVAPEPNPDPTALDPLDPLDPLVAAIRDLERRHNFPAEVGGENDLAVARKQEL